MQTTYLFRGDIINLAIKGWEWGDMVPSPAQSTLVRDDPKMEITVRDNNGIILGVLVAVAHGNDVTATEFRPA